MWVSLFTFIFIIVIKYYINILNIIFVLFFFFFIPNFYTTEYTKNKYNKNFIFKRNIKKYQEKYNKKGGNIKE